MVSVKLPNTIPAQHFFAPAQAVAAGGGVRGGGLQTQMPAQPRTRFQYQVAWQVDFQT